MAAFRDSIYAVEADDDALFREFVAIVNKFIKSGSAYEVNIDCRARTEVMRDVDEARFKELDTVNNGFSNYLFPRFPYTGFSRCIVILFSCTKV